MEKYWVAGIHDEDSTYGCGSPLCGFAGIYASKGDALKACQDEADGRAKERNAQEQPLEWEASGWWTNDAVVANQDGVVYEVRSAKVNS